MTETKDTRPTLEELLKGSKEAEKMWEGGDEVKQEYPPTVNVTGVIGAVYVFDLKISTAIKQETKFGTRDNFVYTGTLKDTTNPEFENLKGKEVSVFGGGLLNYLWCPKGVFTAGVFKLAYMGKEKVGNTEPHQFRMKKLNK